jgi:hypothetical protein
MQVLGPQKTPSKTCQTFPTVDDVAGKLRSRRRPILLRERYLNERRFDVATLDTRAWAVLLALFDECPVLHAGVGTARNPRTLSVSVTDFEFFSEKGQIASVHEFLRSLPETLRR